MSPEQHAAIARAVAAAEAASGLRFRVRVGVLEGGRAGAQSLLAAQGPSGADTVLVAVDPAGRTLEIVTGARAAERLEDRDCGLAALAMTSSFSAGDLVGGIVTGVRMLGDHASSPRMVHLDTQ